MNVIIKHDNVDISNSVIVYDREHEICTGVASLEMEVPLNIGRTFHPWDIIEIWENGNKDWRYLHFAPNMVIGYFLLTLYIGSYGINTYYPICLCAK